MSEFKDLECRTDLTAEQRQRIFAGLAGISAAVKALRITTTGERNDKRNVFSRHTLDNRLVRRRPGSKGTPIDDSRASRGRQDHAGNEELRSKV